LLNSEFTHSAKVRVDDFIRKFINVFVFVILQSLQLIQTYKLQYENHVSNAKLKHMYVRMCVHRLVLKERQIENSFRKATGILSI